MSNAAKQLATLELSTASFINAILNNLSINRTQRVIQLTISIIYSNFAVSSDGRYHLSNYTIVHMYVGSLSAIKQLKKLKQIKLVRMHFVAQKAPSSNARNKV